MEKETKENTSKTAKSLFAETDINEETLQENGIRNHVRLKYFKIQNEPNKYGIEVEKTEYKDDFMKIENEKIKEVTNDEKVVEEMLYSLKKGYVTPCGLTDIIEEIQQRYNLI